MDTTQKRLGRYAIQAGERGQLLAIDLATLDFTPARMFTIADVPPGMIRGGHGPKRGLQLLVLVSGVLSVTVQTDPHSFSRFKLDEPGQTLRINAGEVAWQLYREPGTCLMVLCDTEYDPENYVRVREPLSAAERRAMAEL